jgi:hypothetical protein
MVPWTESMVVAHRIHSFIKRRPSRLDRFNRAKGHVPIYSGPINQTRMVEGCLRRGGGTSSGGMPWPWWRFAGVGVGVHYGLWFSSVPGSNQS